MCWSKKSKINDKNLQNMGLMIENIQPELVEQIGIDF